MTPDDGSFIVIRDLSKRFTAKEDPQRRVLAVDGLSFAQQKESFVSIVGTSGCGKTTLLKMIGGLLPPTSGEILVGDRRVAGSPENEVYVFQDYSKSLLPWRRVAANVGLGLEVMELAPERRAERISKYLRLVGLEHAQDRYPWELSGGMQQRVTLARALACEPDVLLFDEPFGSLDAATRTRLEDELLTLWKTLRTTILFVTHDIEEAIYLSDRILVLRGPPAEIEADLQIDLPRPRDQIDTRSSPGFSELRARIYRMLRD